MTHTLLAMALWMPFASQATPPAPVATLQPSASRSHEALQAAVTDLCARYPASITHGKIGSTASGVPLHSLILSDNAAAADSRPGILVVAGLDGPRWAGTEAALIMAEQLAKEHAELLKQITVYVVPRANPDAAAAFVSGPKRDRSVNLIHRDEDRDRKFDENPPQDLNGDGAITVIRAKDLGPPYGNPTFVVDAADSRILRAPDPLKGEVANYTVFVEGIDTDGDARIAEDGPGGISPDRNFPHRWPEFDMDAGAYPLQAPEAEALVKFVVGHPTLAAAYVIGRVDTVIAVPDGKGKTDAGGPMMITEDDAKAYAAVAKLYRDLVGQTRASESDAAGSFVAWMNAQRGIPTFGAQLWGRPDAPPKSGESPAEAAAPESGDGAKSVTAPKPAETAKPAEADKPAAQDAAPAPSGGGRGRGRGRPAQSAPQVAASEKVAAGSADDADWLAVSDAQGRAGFVEWKPMVHAQLGEVEVGGWIPGWRENPPLDQVRPLGEKSAAFVAALAENRAQVVLQKPRVTVLGPGLYQIDATLANVGRLASIQQGGRSGDVTPAHVVRVSTPVDRVKSGQRMSIVRGMTPGEVRRQQWIVAAAPEEVIELELLFVGQPIKRYTIRNGEVSE